jgi:hypothetical protein
LANILVNYDSEIDKNDINLLKSNIKLVDFGFATHINNTNLLKTAIGSPFNMDPRVLKKFCNNANEFQEYDEKADIWSLGTLCYKMLLGENPFSAKDVQELALKVEEGTFKVPLCFARETISFLLGMLQYEPSKRLSSKELTNHPFLIKYIGDFSYIDLRQKTDKIRYEELYINIKNNETISSIVNIVNKNGEKIFNIMLVDLFPSEIRTKFLLNKKNIEEIKEKVNKEISPQIMSFNTYNGNYSSINNINNRLSFEGGDKYSLSGAEMVNSTPMPISAITSNNVNNLKRKEKDTVKNKLLEIPIPKNEKSILNSLIEINEKASNLSQSAQQSFVRQMIINENQKLGLSKQIHYKNNNQIHNEIYGNIKDNNTPEKIGFSSSNKNVNQITNYNRESNNYFNQIPIYQGFNINKELSRINTNIDKESLKYYQNQNQMKDNNPGQYGSKQSNNILQNNKKYSNNEIRK